MPDEPCCPNSTCQEMLCKAIAAYNEIITGTGVVEVTIDGETTKFQMTNVKMLKAHIATLHSTCGNELSAALLGIPCGGRRAIQVVYADAHLERRGKC